MRKDCQTPCVENRVETEVTMERFHLRGLQVHAKTENGIWRIRLRP